MLEDQVLSPWDLPPGSRVTISWGVETACSLLLWVRPGVNSLCSRPSAGSLPSPARLRVGKPIWYLKNASGRTGTQEAYGQEASGQGCPGATRPARANLCFSKPALTLGMVGVGTAHVRVNSW